LIVLPRLARRGENRGTLARLVRHPDAHNRAIKGFLFVMNKGKK